MFKRRSMSDAIGNMVSDLRERDFVVFVGAGIPRPTGVRNWEELLKDLNKLAPVGGMDLGKVEARHYPEIAQMVYVNLEETGRQEEYYKALEKLLESSATSWTSVHWKIAKACDSIVTTNLDTTFEDALNETLRDRGCRCNYQTLPRLSCEDLRKPHHISYLHGRRGDRDIILKTADYVRWYASLNGGAESDLEKVLRKIFCSHVALVFVGLSFSDRYLFQTFEEAFKRMQARVKDGDPGAQLVLNKIGHYALMPKVLSEEEERDYLQTGGDSNQDPRCNEARAKQEAAGDLERRLRQIKVEVIWYEYGKHKALEGIFEQITGSKRSSVSQE